MFGVVGNNAPTEQETRARVQMGIQALLPPSGDTLGDQTECIADRHADQATD
jgi:hypothetical protein